MVAIDREDLKAVLVNLLTNAIQAVDPGGRILYHHRTCRKTAQRSAIDDNGCGISPEHLPRLFDPFFTSGKVAGTGLGLSVSYGIVSRHGGRIDVQFAAGAGCELSALVAGSHRGGTLPHHRYG